MEGVGVTGGGPIPVNTSAGSGQSTNSNINLKTDDININHNNIDMLNVVGSAAAASAPTPTLLADPMVAAAAYPSPNSNEAYLHAMPYTGDAISAQEEEELRQWASFKEFQKTFMKDEGLLYST